MTPQYIKELLEELLSKGEVVLTSDDVLRFQNDLEYKTLLNELHLVMKSDNGKVVIVQSDDVSLTEFWKVLFGYVDNYLLLADIVLVGDNFINLFYKYVEIKMELVWFLYLVRNMKLPYYGQTLLNYALKKSRLYKYIDYTNFQSKYGKDKLECLSKLKEYACKFLIPDKISQGELDKLIQPKISYYEAINNRTLEYSINDIDRLLLDSLVNATSPKFNLSKFFGGDKNYTSSALGIFSKNSDSVLVDCQISLQFNDLPIKSVSSHENVAIIIYKFLYGVNIYTLDNSKKHYSIGNIKTDDWKKTIVQNGNVVLQLCNQHERGNKHSLIWLPEYLTPYQIEELKEFNKKLKELCSRDPKFYQKYPLEFSFSMWNSETNSWQKEDSSINGIDGIFEYIDRYNKVPIKHLT